MGRVAISISHESDFAVAIAYGVRTAGGRFLYPPDIEERLSEREASLMRRFERLRGLAKEVAINEAKLAADAGRSGAATAPEEGTDA
jgi:hypothetical protein